MNSPLRVGLIGAGRIGLRHAHNLLANPNARLVAVHDLDHGAAERAAAGVARIAADEAGVLEAADVDAVVIASPTPEHAGQIVRAAEAGKAIFCEKPVTLDLASTRAAMARVTALGVPFQIGFNRRYDPTFAAIAADVHAGAIGTPESYRGISTDAAPPPEAYIAVSGGLFVDSAIHDFDLARFVMGEISHVTTLGRVLIDPAFARHGDVDTAIVTLSFASGAIGVIQNSRRARFGHQVRVEVYGELGRVEGEDSHTPRIVRSDAAGVHTPHVAGFLERFAAAYRAEIDAFVANVRRGEPCTPGATDAIAALAIAEAATRSLASGAPEAVAT
jgi:myo-inositol 2-dehydrogenase / D-chiro-inositol 1-dehydrogenase